jgi:hypothetical protein
MLIQWLAGLLLLAALWMLFRFAMGLRWAKLSREEGRARVESSGRRVVAEVPLAGGELSFFQEDRAGFYWAGHHVARAEVAGARLLLNGNVVGAAARPSAVLPDPPSPEELAGRERWDVWLYLAADEVARVRCGSLGEGVSREIAARVFEAVRREVEP